jgi:hypothetical protein
MPPEPEFVNLLGSPGIDSVYEFGLRSLGMQTMTVLELIYFWHIISK